MRQWTYQTCNEFGWFQTSESMHQPFGTKYPLHFFTTLCADAYGELYTAEYIQQRINDTNKRFGGIELDVQNVYWTQGQLDPWIEAGKQTGPHTTVIPCKKKNPDSFLRPLKNWFLLISDHAHCKDLDSISDEDAPALIASKKRIAHLVREWLA